MAKLKGKLGCTLNLRYAIVPHRRCRTYQKIDRKLWYCDVVTPQSCPCKWGKWTKRICEEMNLLFWFFLKLGRRAHHDRFFPTFGIILAQTSLRRQLLKVSNIRNGIHCIILKFFFWNRKSEFIQDLSKLSDFLPSGSIRDRQSKFCLQREFEQKSTGQTSHTKPPGQRKNRRKAVRPQQTQMTLHSKIGCRTTLLPRTLGRENPPPPPPPSLGWNFRV